MKVLDSIKQATNDPTQQSELWMLFYQLQYVPENWWSICDAIRSYINKNDISPDLLLTLNEVQENLTEMHIAELDNVKIAA